jgi:hypothetical protein
MSLAVWRWAVLHRAAALSKSCTPLFGDMAPPRRLTFATAYFALFE